MYGTDTGVIKSKKCSVCGDVNVGVESGGQFVCANCDRDSFDAAAEAQKELYLSGDSSFNSDGA